MKNVFSMLIILPKGILKLSLLKNLGQIAKSHFNATPNVVNYGIEYSF
jgi:hypothetical protein